MTEYQSSALNQIIGGYIFPLTISAIYFYKHNTKSYIQRILVSSHGAIFVSASIYAVIASKHTTIDHFQGEFNIFQGILVVGLLSTVYSLYKFNGSKLIHLSQAVNLAAAAVFWFVGGMTLSHDWI